MRSVAENIGRGGKVLYKYRVSVVSMIGELVDIYGVDFRRYDGGRIEVQNRPEHYFCMGEILSAGIEGSGITKDLVVELAWMARNVLRAEWPEGSQPPLTDSWVEDPRKRYVTSLAIYRVQDVERSRIFLVPAAGGDKTMLFPRGSKRPVRPMMGK
jgi:hypothetical protein